MILRSTLWIVLSLGLLQGVGCATTPQGLPQPEDRQSGRMIPPGVTEPLLLAGGVAVLEPSPDSGAEGMRNNLAFELFQALRVGYPKAKIYSRPDTLGFLTEADLHREVEHFLEAYARDRQIDWDLLARVGEEGRVRYLFYSRLEGLGQQTDVAVLDQGETFVNGKVTVFSSGPNLLPVSVVKSVHARGELWDLRCRAVVWVGEGGSRLVEPVGEEQLRVEDLFIRTGRLLVGSLQQAAASGKDHGGC